MGKRIPPRIELGVPVSLVWAVLGETLEVLGGVELFLQGQCHGKRRGSGVVVVV